MSDRLTNGALLCWDDLSGEHFLPIYVYKHMKIPSHLSISFAVIIMCQLLYVNLMAKISYFFYGLDTSADSRIVQ